MIDPVAAAKYCASVCGGRCCTLHNADEGSVRCPRLKDDNTCGVYKERYADYQPRLVVVGTFISRKLKRLDGEYAERPFVCGFIEDILKAGALPKEIEAGCCYAHPELLEGI